MKKKPQKLNRKSQNLFDDFDQCAMSWGWTSDQGSGNAVDRSKKNYDESKAALERYIISLEEKIRKLKNPDRGTDPLKYVMEPGKIMM